MNGPSFDIRTALVDATVSGREAADTIVMAAISEGSALSGAEWDAFVQRHFAGLDETLVSLAAGAIERALAQGATQEQSVEVGLAYVQAMHAAVSAWQSGRVTQ